MANAASSTERAAPSPVPIPCAYAPANPPAHVYDKIITVAVGPDAEKKKYKIYRGLLCHFSSYFDRMLNGSFREGGSTYLRLSDTDTDTFNAFYYWLNSGVVNCTTWAQMVNAYVFADFHQAPLFQNAILESLYIHWFTKNEVSVNVTEVLYANTSEEDRMRKLIVDIMVVTGGFQQPDRCFLLDCHKEFLVDIVVACRERGLVPGDGSGIDGEAWFADMRNRFCERYHIHRERQAS